jgi:urocanate hydratase
MKNEVRKRTPLSVALSADPLEMLDQILARGLAPQLFSSYLNPDAKILTAAEKFHSLGAELIDFEDGPAHPQFRQSATILQPLLASRSWTMRTFTFQSATQLRQFDTFALKMFPLHDRLRHRWIEAASRILQRQRPPQRCLWLSPEEEENLSAELSRISRS